MEWGGNIQHETREGGSCWHDEQGRDGMGIRRFFVLVVRGNMAGGNNNIATCGTHGLLGIFGVSWLLQCCFFFFFLSTSPVAVGFW